MERKDTVRQAEYLHGNRKEEQPGNGKVAIYKTMHTEDGMQEQPMHYTIHGKKCTAGIILWKLSVTH